MASASALVGLNMSGMTVGCDGAGLSLHSELFHIGDVCQNEVEPPGLQRSHRLCAVFEDLHPVARPGEAGLKSWVEDGRRCGPTRRRIEEDRRRIDRCVGLVEPALRPTSRNLSPQAGDASMTTARRRTGERRQRASYAWADLSFRASTIVCSGTKVLKEFLDCPWRTFTTAGGTTVGRSIAVAAQNRR